MIIPPQKEIDILKNDILSYPEYFDFDYVIKEYKKYCNRVYIDPFNNNLATYVKEALKNKKPTSIIRIGDGEINMMTYDCYSKTPILNDFVAKKSLKFQLNSFNPSPFWLLILKNLMMNSLSQADIIGVLGIWRRSRVKHFEIASKIDNSVRGVSGQWRGIDFMLGLAKKNDFQNQIIAPAHLYFSIVLFLDSILHTTRTVYLITNCNNTVNKLRKKYPNVDFRFVNLIKTIRPITLNEPEFLYTTLQQLPNNMNGTLTLVGAGLWSQIYCNWIKQKGGVAIDIGSGFDLMDGRVIRPLHKNLDQKIISKCCIT